MERVVLTLRKNGGIYEDRKKNTFLYPSFLIGLLVLSGCATVSSKTPAGISSSTQETQETTEEQSDGAYIKDVVFEKMKGKEQVSILLSDIPDFDISRKSGNALVIKLRGVSIPKGMKNEYSGDGLRNLKSISLHQGTAEGGKRHMSRCS